MSGKDQFADLFSSVSKKKDTSNLSLLERQKLSSNVSSFNNGNASNNQWGDFDLLSGSGSSGPSFTQSSKTNNNDLFEGFDTLNASNSKTTASSTTQNNNFNSTFDGFGLSSEPKPNSQTAFDSFDLPLSSNNTTQSTFQQPAPNQSQSQDLDDLFAVFDNPPKKQEPVIETPKPVNPQSQSHLLRNTQPQAPRSRKATPHIDSDARDEAIASLIDMGFDIEQANDALNHTSDGTNLQQAISYIMNAAHKKTTNEHGPPVPQRPSHGGSSLGFGGKTTEQYLNNFSSILGSVSNKVLNEANKYFHSPSSSGDGTPAWMKDQAKYRANGKNYEEDPDELDEETIRRLTISQNEKHRQRDRERLKERNRSSQSSFPSRTESSSVPVNQATPSQPIVRPQSTRPKEQHVSHEPEVDLFSPVPSNTRAPEPEVDLFSSTVPTQRKPAFDNNEMRTSSRRRQATPSRSSPISVTKPSTTKLRASNVTISSTQMEFFKDSREQGGLAFKNGDFTSALTHYQTALDALPPNHPLRIIAYSNCITAYFKVGENKKVVELSNLANELIGPERGQNEEVEAGKSIKEFWIKINSKKAESLEHTENFKDALTVWTELIENGSTSNITLEGKRRCLNFLEPKKSTPKPKPSSAPKPRPRNPTPRSSPAQDSEALKKIQKVNQDSEQFEQDKFRLYDSVESKVNAWKNAKEDNLRALLSSLQNILWESANWKTVNMSDLVIPKKVKLVYLKAVAKVHPDKIPQNATSEQKLIAQSVFVVINQAWESFKQQNNIQ